MMEANMEFERNTDGSLTLLGKHQQMQFHIEGKCAGCGSAYHDRYPTLVRGENRCICPDPLGGRHDLNCMIHGRDGMDL